MVLLASPVEATQWHLFRWAMGSVVPGTKAEKVAIVLPVTINSIPCFMQLDTGIQKPVIWGDRPNEFEGSRQVAVKLRVLSISARVTAPTQTLKLLRAKHGCSVDDPIGTLGNAFFEHGTLTLDLRRSRFAFTPKALLAHTPDAHPFIYANWSGGAGGLILVDIKRPGGSEGKAGLDTGSARFGLIVNNAQDWADQTAGVPLENNDNVKAFKIPSWGREITCYETTPSQPLEVAGVRLSPVPVAYCPELGAKPPVKLIGILGMRALGKRILTLDYLSKRWTLAIESKSAWPKKRRRN